MGIASISEEEIDYEYLQCRDNLHDDIRRLKSILSASDVMVLEEIVELSSRMNEILNMREYVQGFKTGVRVMMEVIE